VIGHYHISANEIYGLRINVMKKPQLADTHGAWVAFAQYASLTQEQVDLFKQYYEILIAWNKKINVTAIVHERDVIDYHFKDSLQIHTIVDMQTMTHGADVGTGGGFPGVALLIKYPQMMFTLIEVNTKKIKFLEELAVELGLQDRITIFNQDWRTFLRTTAQPIQLFCARASLQPEELIRMFKPSSAYKDASLVYWASALWQPSQVVAPYIIKDIEYTIRNKKRRLILLQQNHHS
jgi:16S rRNA (guanine527-N7)-methyltransferase